MEPSWIWVFVVDLQFQIGATLYFLVSVYSTKFRPTIQQRCQILLLIYNVAIVVARFIPEQYNFPPWQFLASPLCVSDTGIYTGLRNCVAHLCPHNVLVSFVNPVKNICHTLPEPQQT